MIGATENANDCAKVKPMTGLTFQLGKWLMDNKEPPMTEPFVSKCCIGEKCFCGQPAEHKVAEDIAFDDPHPHRHGLTRYICHMHFREIMGPAADRRV